jgi:enoyl-[acyl-carrier protein] reductase II
LRRYKGASCSPFYRSVKLMQRAGASAVIAEGGESGGLIGRNHNHLPCPAGVRQRRLTRGGMRRNRRRERYARGLHARRRGCSGSPRFLVAEECTTIQTNYKERILKARAIDTITHRQKAWPYGPQSENKIFPADYWEKNTIPRTNDDLKRLATGRSGLRRAKETSRGGCPSWGQIAGMVKKGSPPPR